MNKNRSIFNAAYALVFVFTPTTVVLSNPMTPFMPAVYELLLDDQVKPDTPNPEPPVTEPPVTDPPVTSRKPGANNTGPTQENLLVDSGSIRVRANWAGGGTGTPEDPFIVENLNILGTLKIQVPNVLVRNVRASANALYVLQTNYDGVSNVVVEDSEFMGGRTKTSAPIIVKNGVTLRRLAIHESGGDGVKVQGSNFTMESCWIYNLGAKPGSHADGVQGTVNSGRWSNHVYRGNFLDMAVDELTGPYQSNATIFLHTKNNASGVDGVIIEDNWLIGGNFSLPIENDMTGVVVRNNKFGRIGKEVRFGLIRISSNDKIISGNTYEDTGELIPNQ